MRSAVVQAALGIALSAAVVHGQVAGLADAPVKAHIGIAFQGLKPQQEFANNVHFAGGLGAHFLKPLDPQGIFAFRVDLGYLIYGSESYRVPLGGGPLGLINVDVTTTNNIVVGGVGLQAVTPGRTLRPYANVSAGFSYFFTGSSVAGTDQDSPFASSTNYSDGGLAWSAGGGFYIPLTQGSTPVQLDLGVRWLDNGSREYLRPDGITFVGNTVRLDPVRTDAPAVQFHLGVIFGLR